MTFAQFSRQARLSQREFCLQMLSEHRDSIKIKKDKTAVKNLELIFESTLRLSNQKGFQAMTMRDLSAATGLSMGTLYDHFSSKDELLEMLQATHGRVIGRALEQGVADIEGPWEKLSAAVRTHLFISEALQPYFFFAYMESRHLGPVQRKRAKEGELATERFFSDIIQEGQAAGVLAPVDAELTASLIKAMVQDWYLKRWKYSARHVSVGRYADMVIDMLRAHCLPGQDALPPEKATRQ